MSGTIQAPIGARVLLSVNDRVASVSEVFDDVTAGNRFAGLVPEPLLQDGDNDPQLFLMIEDGDETVLREVDFDD